MHTETLAEEVEANRANKQIVTKCFLQIIDCDKAQGRVKDGGGLQGCRTTWWSVRVWHLQLTGDVDQTSSTSREEPQPD